MNIAMKTTLMLVALFSQAATAAAVSRVDAKKLLNLTEGHYVVSKSDAKLLDGDLICVPKTSSTVKWDGSAQDPVLSIGGAAPYTDFNNGLRTAAIAGDEDKCKYQHSTLAEAGKLIDDRFANCADQNTHTHTEITFKADSIDYSVKMSISKNGKVLEAPGSCTLNLKKDVKP